MTITVIDSRLGPKPAGPCTPESVARAKAAADAERQRNGIELGPDGKIRIAVMSSVRSA